MAKELPATFVCLDANILIRIVSQGQPGCESEHWDELRGMVEGSKVTLLSPQIVLMEFEKQVWNSEEDFHLQTARITESLKSVWANTWNEVRGNLKDFLEDQLGEWRTNIAGEWKKRGDEIRTWLTSHAAPVPFNQEIWFQAKQRLIEGRFPKTKNPKETEKDKSKGREWDRDNDCSIIESLVVHFAGQLDDKQLLFCTENLDDFGFKVSDKNSLDGRLQDGLPPTEIFTDLKSLLKALKDRKTIQLPTSEELQQALEREAQVAVEKEETVASSFNLRQAVVAEVARQSIPKFGVGDGIVKMMWELEQEAQRKRREEDKRRKLASQKATIQRNQDEQEKRAENLRNLHGD